MGMENMGWVTVKLDELVLWVARCGQLLAVFIKAILLVEFVISSILVKKWQMTLLALVIVLVIEKELDACYHQGVLELTFTDCLQNTLNEISDRELLLHLVGSSHNSRP